MAGLLGYSQDEMVRLANGGKLSPKPKGLLGDAHWMDKLAMGTMATPLLGDVTGLAADARTFIQEPESRTPANFGLSALGLLPFMPAMGTIKGLDFKGQSKLFTDKVFNKPVGRPSAAARDKADELIDTGEYSSIPMSSVNVEDLIPTQRFIHESNMGRLDPVDSNTGAYILKEDGKYYILDGHHRITNRISAGDKNIKAHVFE